MTLNNVYKHLLICKFKKYIILASYMNVNNQNMQIDY